MRNFWRAGLVVLVWLAACGDDKADQAAALKQEVQDMLGKLAGPSKSVTYGEVTVTPQGDAFAVTIDKVALSIPDSQPIDLGKVGFKLTPEGDDIRKFSDVSLPQTLVFKAPDGKEARMTVALDHATGSWSKKMGQLLTADVLAKDLQVTETAGDSKLIASDVFYQIHTEDKGAGSYDQGGAIGSRLMTIGDKDGQVAIADLKLASDLGGARLAEIFALRSDWQKAAESNKPGELLSLVSRTFKLFKSMKASVSASQLTASAGGTTMFSLGGFSLDFGLQDTDQAKVKVSSGLRYAGLSIPQIKDLVGGMGAEVLPTDFNVNINVADLPMAAILDSWAKTLPAANVTDGSAMMGTGMMAAGVAVQAIQQAAVKLALSDGRIKAPGVSGSFTGDVNSDPKAAMGFTGSANVELSDLDALIAKAQSYADQPTTSEILGALQMMRALSDHGTDASGRPVDRFKITMDAAGNTLVNGKSIQPPAPSGEQPASPDAGSDSGGGSDSGAGQ